MESGVEALHARFFNALAEVFPGLLHLHYGLADEADDGLWGLGRRLREGPERLTEALLALADPSSLPPQAQALDLGCGLGGTCLALAKASPKLQVLGVNLTDPQVELARGRVRRAGLEQRVRIERADARALPLPDGSVDLITLVECAFHIPDKDRLFSEIARVLRPGGRLVMADQERPAGALSVMDMFFFPDAGAYERLGADQGLVLTQRRDLSPQVAAWMRDYARSASAPFMVAISLWLTLRGRGAVARAWRAGSRHFEDQIRAELSRRGRRLPPGTNPVRALRLHTREELLRGDSVYGLWRFERAG